MPNPSSPWTFLHANDSHMGTPRSYRFAPDYNHRWAAIKRQMADIDAAFLLHGGDFTRDGDSHEQEYQHTRNDLLNLPFPVHAIPGNMDVGNKHTSRDGRQKDVSLNMTSERLRLFASYFGPLQWSFVYRDVRFTGFYAAVTGSGLPEERMFWEHLDAIRHAPRAARHVVVMHYWLFIESLDEPTWNIADPEQYHNWYFSIDREPRLRIFDWMQATGVDTVFSGHVHTGRPVTEVDGVRFYRTPSAGNRPQLHDRWPDAETRQGFHRCDVHGDDIRVTFVPCDDQTLVEAKAMQADSFGPGGHPPVDRRDYQAARQHPPLTPDPDPTGLP